MSPYLYGCLAIIGGLVLCVIVLVFLIATAPKGREDERGYHDR